MASRPKNFSMVIAWTGHRSLADEALVSKAASAVVDRLLALSSASGDERGDPLPRFVVGVGSVAIGADTIIAEILRDRSIPLIVRLPFEQERFEADASSERRARIASLLASARFVTVAPRQPTDEEAFLESGVSMVEQADVLIAVWDGQTSRGVGGTQQVVDFAGKLKVPVVRIDPATGNIEWPEPGIARAVPGFTGTVYQLRARSDVERAFQEMDNLAKKRSTNSRLALFWIILLHLAASAIAILVALVLDESAVGREAEHNWSLFAGALKVSALTWAFVLAYTYRPKHKQWLEARTGAELCRSFLAAWKMRRDAISMPPAPTLSTEPLRRELELAWLLDAPASPDLESARLGYLSGVGQDDPANPGGRLQGQRHYFAREEQWSVRIGHVLKRAAETTTALAILLGVVAIVIPKTWLGDSVYHTIKAFSIALPLATAAMLSYATGRDLTRRTARFREMAERLETIEHRVSAARTWPALGRAVTEAEWLLQGELEEWHAFTRYAGELHS